MLPDAIPVHAALRLLSAATGFGAVAIVWRALHRFVSPADAAVTAALVACAPVVAIATSMLGNETLCALFATAALARTLEQRSAAPAVLLATLAALAKSTGLALLGVVGLDALWRARRAPAEIARTLGLVGAAAALLLALHYGRLVAATGSIAAVVSGGTAAGLAAAEMATQPPGERHLADYVSLPIATFVAPFKDGAGMVRSVPGLLYATTWADGQGALLPSSSRAAVTAAALAALAGLVPTILAALGLVRLLRRPELRARAGAALGFGALLLAAFLAQTWLVPRYSAVKASYLLSALLPASLALGVGLGSTGPVARALLRAALLAVGAFATFLTWYGWWE